MKRFLCILFVIAMIMGMTASAFAADSNREVVRVAWLGLNPDDTIDPISGIKHLGSYVLKELVESKLPNVEIEFIMVPGDGWLAKMDTIITAGDTDIGWYTNQIIAPTWFVDHKQFMENDPDFPLEKFYSSFAEGAIKYSTYSTFDYPQNKGEIYGLPYGMTSNFLMYDKLLLEQWGVPEPSRYPTFAELLDIAQKTTGANPKTGRQNYGAFIQSYWCEWLGVGADLYRVVDNPTMDINLLDIDYHVNYVLDSPEILGYFQFLEDAIKCSPPGAPAGMGFEKWMTPDNDIAVMLDIGQTGDLYSHIIANNSEVTDRFIPVYLPLGEQGKSGFPEFHHLAVTKSANNPELAWEVVKLIATDADCLNYIFENNTMSALPAVLDTAGIRIMNDLFTIERYENRKTTVFLSDDYWHWRQPMQQVFPKLFTGEINAEEARELLHTNMLEWIANKKAQLGS